MNIFLSSGAGGSDHRGARSQGPQIPWKDETLSYEDNRVACHQKFNELISFDSIFSFLTYLVFF